MELSFVIGVLVGALQAGTSVLYAALGQSLSDRRELDELRPRADNACDDHTSDRIATDDAHR